LIVAGLTGGIATGKSTVSAIFKSVGAIVIDADAIAREVVEKEKPAWHKIVEHFGRGILLADGELNRPLLADIIFNNPAKKEILNNIVHPFVTAEIDERLKQIKGATPEAVVILDVPLLIETGTHKGLQEVILVYAPEHVQLQRLRQRDNLSEPAARARIHSQMPIDEKKKWATIVIDNAGIKEKTRKATVKVYQYLKSKAP
jgi:dephospho-CoA kinase